MPDAWSRRRALRAVGAAAALGFSGCEERIASTPTDSRSTADQTTAGPETPTEAETTAPANEHDRPTATERAPRPLDVDGEWRQFGSGPGHDGATDATGLPENGEVYWHLRRIRSGGPVLADGRLFHYAKLGRDASGRPTITRTVAEPSTAHPVYGEAALLARDARDGRIEWIRSFGEVHNAWAAVENGTVVACVRGEVGAFDARSGQRTWTVDLDGRDPADPTVVDGTVIVPIQGQVARSGEYEEHPQVRAYALEDGAEQWSVDVPGSSTVAAGDGIVAVVSGSENGSSVVLGLSLDDGSERWRTETPGDAWTTLVANGAVVFRTDEFVRTLELTDGSSRWRRDFENRPGAIAADGETVFVEDGSSVSALGQGDGKLTWQFEPTSVDGYVQTIASGAETVYVGMIGDRAPLVTLDRENGDERWRHAFPNKVVEGDMILSGVESQPVVAEGGLYVNAVDGFYAFGPAE